MGWKSLCLSGVFLGGWEARSMRAVWLWGMVVGAMRAQGVHWAGVCQALQVLQASDLLSVEPETRQGAE